MFRVTEVSGARPSEVITAVHDRVAGARPRHEGEGLHRVILDNMAEGVCLIRAGDLAIVYANPRFTQIFGYDVGELDGQPVGILNDASDPVEARAMAERIVAELEREGRASYEIRNRRKDGTPFWCRANATAFDHPEHGPVWVVVQTDITVEKEAAERVRASERLLQTVIDSLPVGVWITDRDGRITRGNPAGQRVWAGARYVGVEQYGEYRGWWADTGQPIAADEWALARAVRRGETSVGELVRIRCFDGSFKTILNSAVPLRDGDRIAGAIVVNEDVTRLLEAEALSSGVVAAAPDAILATDGERRIVVFNAGAERMFGCGRDDALGRDLDLVVGGAACPVLDDILAAAATGVVEVRPLIARRRSGETFPVEVSAASTRSGLLRRYTLVIRDVTARVRAEQERAALARALEEDRARLARLEVEQRFLADAGGALAESLGFEDTLHRIATLAVPRIADGCVISLVDERGHVEPAVVHCEDAGVQAALDASLRRYPLRDAARGAGQVVRTGVPELVPDLPESVWDELARDPEQLELMRRADVRSYLTVPLRARDEILGALTLLDTGAARRVGPRELALAELLGQRAGLAIDNARLYRAARRATEARDEVLAVVAHDIRTPLSAILFAADALARAAPPDDAAAARGASMVHRSVAQIDRLIGDLLDAARLEAGTLTLERGAIDVADVVAEAVETVRARAREHAVEIDVPVGIPAVFADRYRILQVLGNLLGNAVKFTPAGGRVVCAAERLADEVVIRVRDTGRGLTPAQRAHVFDRYWQASPSDRRGAGLGLAIAKGLIDAHDGRIWVDSEPGAGATFAFTLPLVR